MNRVIYNVACGIYQVELDSREDDYSFRVEVAVGSCAPDIVPVGPEVIGLPATEVVVTVAPDWLYEVTY